MPEAQAGGFDAWDFTQGTFVTAASALFSGSNPNDMLGGCLSGTERGNVIFAGGPAGTLQFVEWQTPAPVTIRSFRIFASSDGGPSFNRSFSKLRLYAKDLDTLTWTLIYEFDTTIPYDMGAFPQWLVLTDKVTEVPSDQFRAEFVQVGTTGSRIIELDGYETDVAPEEAGWEVYQNVTVTASSGFRSGINGLDLFGNCASSERGNILFADLKPAGFVHYIEWSSPVARSPRSFNLLAAHEAASPPQRAFSEFRLYGWDSGSSSWTQLYQTSVGIPYGGGDQGNFLLLNGLIPTFTTDKWRAEFVQPSGSTTGPRVMELEAYPNLAPIADAGPDQNAGATTNCLATVTLDGSGSTDPEGDSLTYTWTGSFGTVTGQTAVVNLGVGVHEVTLTVEDGLGGISDDTVQITVTDAEAPMIGVSGPVNASADSNCMGAIPGVFGVVSVMDNCTPANSLNIWQSPLPGTPAALGTHNVTVFASDAAGNVATANVTVNIVDTTAPSSTCPGPQTLGTGVNGTALVPDFTTGVVAMDACTPANQLVISQSPAPGTVVGPGIYLITVSVTDAAGNVGQCVTALSVLDGTAPVISSLTADPFQIEHQNALVPVQLTAVVTDNADPAPFVHIVSVTANMSITYPGPGVHNPDIEITGDMTLSLQGKKKGRIYTITVEAVDSSGNTSTATVDVAVVQ